MGEGCCGGGASNGSSHHHDDGLMQMKYDAKDGPSVEELHAGEALLAAFAGATAARMVAADVGEKNAHGCAGSNPKKVMKTIGDCVIECGIEERLESHTFLCSEQGGPAPVDLHLANAICASPAPKGQQAMRCADAASGLRENGCPATARWLRTVCMSPSYVAYYGDAMNQADEESASGTHVSKKGRVRAFVKGDVLTGTGDAESKKEYFNKRVELFEKFRARELEKVEAARALGEKITITLPSGDTKEGMRGVTTGMDIALGISKGLASKSIVCKVDGELRDLNRPLDKDCKLELCSFDSPDGKETFWHSSAHLLGMTLELGLGADLTIGPPTKDGFYYDCYIGERTLHEDDLLALKKSYDAAVKQKSEFQRAEVTREEALSMFQENKFKIELISGLPDGETVSVYRVGPMVDLCTGPHMPHSGLAKSVWLHQASRSYWRADVNREHLMRVYGVTYPDDKQLKKHQHRIEEAKKRDHRTLGIAHDLFFFHQLSPGSCFFTPHGARVYHAMMGLIREKYWEFEYHEVITPNVFNFKLWETSGHAQHYKQNMFAFNIESEEFGMKPMNCPAHCVMFKERARSYRDLPLRVADFGVLHRNEFSGALHGLTRVRRFQQDDGHIFCRHDQVQAEVQGFLRFLDEVYAVFGLEYELKLSTRPDDYLGELEVWDAAEKALTDALNHFGKPWELNEGDGAFYGPKIDITVFDALGRSFQCATVQLDFQLPIRFDLKYARESSGQNGDDERYERPVIVHRAVLGSVERMFAILVEHFACKWPLWLNPRQVMVVPVSEKFGEYAALVRQRLRSARFHVDVDVTDRKMQKKVREAQLEQYNYILVVGKDEEDSQTVNVRTRDNVVHGAMPLDALLDCMRAERDGREPASSLVASKVTPEMGKVAL